MTTLLDAPLREPMRPRAGRRYRHRHQPARKGTRRAAAAAYRQERTMVAIRNVPAPDAPIGEVTWPCQPGAEPNFTVASVEDGPGDDFVTWVYESGQRRAFARTDLVAVWDHNPPEGTPDDIDGNTAPPEPEPEPDTASDDGTSPQPPEEQPA